MIDVRVVLIDVCLHALCPSEGFSQHDISKLATEIWSARGPCCFLQSRFQQLHDDACIEEICLRVDSIIYKTSVCDANVHHQISRAMLKASRRVQGKAQARHSTLKANYQKIEQRRSKPKAVLQRSRDCKPWPSSQVNFGNCLIVESSKNRSYHN